MGKVYRKQMVEGVTIPAIIHNSSYFLIQMAVYEDGTVSCWHKSDMKQFKEDLRRGWVVPQIPEGAELSVHHLGAFPVKEARWAYDVNGYYHRVKDVVRTLNPEMKNLYHTTQREIDKWDKARVRWQASPTCCKLKEGLGYNLLDGESSYIFYRQERKCYLTELTVYADRTARIEAVGERYFTQEEIRQFFSERILYTVPEEGEWVAIDGLGELLLAAPVYGGVAWKEKLKEIENMVSSAAGEETAHDRCMQAYYNYLTYPDDWTREMLRKAYEEVPEHERMYLGDMDTRDSDFQRILYHPEQKREV